MSLHTCKHTVQSWVNKSNKNKNTENRNTKLPKYIPQHRNTNMCVCNWKNLTVVNDFNDVAIGRCSVGQINVEWHEQHSKHCQRQLQYRHNKRKQFSFMTISIISNQCNITKNNNLNRKTLANFWKKINILFIKQKKSKETKRNKKTSSQIKKENIFSNHQHKLKLKSDFQNRDLIKQINRKRKNEKKIKNKKKGGGYCQNTSDNNPSQHWKFRHIDFLVSWSWCCCAIVHRCCCHRHFCRCCCVFVCCCSVTIAVDIIDHCHALLTHQQATYQ